MNWAGKDGPVSAWREGDRLYLFSGNVVHEMVLPVKTPDPDPAATLPYSEDFNDLSADALDAARGNWFINGALMFCAIAMGSIFGIGVAIICAILTFSLLYGLRGYDRKRRSARLKKTIAERTARKTAGGN